MDGWILAFSWLIHISRDPCNLTGLKILEILRFLKISFRNQLNQTFFILITWERWKELAGVSRKGKRERLPRRPFFKTTSQQCWLAVDCDLLRLLSSGPQISISDGLLRVLTCLWIRKLFTAAAISKRRYIYYLYENCILLCLWKSKFQNGLTWSLCIEHINLHALKILELAITHSIQQRFLEDIAYCVCFAYCT